MSFNFFFDLIGGALAFLYSIVPSMGFAIIGLTLAVMIVLTPLTLKGTRSMMMMQQLQPEMKKLQSKYKDDRQKLNEELLKFYKENNINPVGGCLPLLVQMPVFLVLYNVLRGLTQRVPSMGSNTGWVTGQFGAGQPFTKPPVIHNNFVPDHIPTDSSMYQTLSQTNTMPFLGMDLSQSCSEALQQGIVHAIPYALLIVVVGISGFVQQRQIQGRNPQANINPQQQQIMKIMPIFLPVISFGLPAGLVLYFAVSNLYRIGQQWFISRSIYGIRRGETAEQGGTADGKGASKQKVKAGAGGSNGSSPKGGGRGTGGASAEKKPSKATAASGSKSTAASSTGARKASQPNRSPNRSPNKSPNKSPNRPPDKTPVQASAGGSSSDGGSGNGAARGGRTRAMTTKSIDAKPTSSKATSTKSSGSGSTSTEATPAARTEKPAPAKESTAREATSNRDGATPPPTMQPRARKKKR